MTEPGSTDRPGEGSPPAGPVGDGAVGDGPDQSSAARFDPITDPLPPPQKRRLRGLLPRPLWNIGRLLILALIIEYLVVPQLAGPRKLLHLLTEVNPLLLLAGVGLEVGALLSYACLTRAVLPRDTPLKLFTILRIQLTTLSVSHCAPGGTATGSALGYRLMTQFGEQPAAAGFALGVQGIGSAVVLNLILWVALVVSIPVWGFSAVYLLAAAVGAALLAAAAVLIYVFTRGVDRAGTIVGRAASRIPFVDSDALGRAFLQLADRLADLAGDREVLIRAISWAVLNWLLDASSLLVFVGAFGHWANPDGLLVAYGLANVLAVIPITPAGLGVVEATLTTLLVGFGTPRGIATLGVIAYRLVNFWAPIPLGGIAYISLHVDRQGAAIRANRDPKVRRSHAPFDWPWRHRREAVD